MRISQGAYTQAKTIQSQAGAQQFIEYDLSAKVLPTSVVEGRKCTFRLADNSEITMNVYSGTTIPLVTKACKFEDTVTTGEMLTVIGANDIPQEYRPDQTESLLSVETSTQQTATGPDGTAYDLSTVFDVSQQTTSWTNNDTSDVTIVLPSDFTGGVLFQPTGSVQVSALHAGQEYVVSPDEVLVTGVFNTSPVNHNLDAASVNLLGDNSVWTNTLGSSVEKTITSDITTSFGRYYPLPSTSGENKLVTGLDPYGRSRTLWRATDIDSTSSSEGGFDVIRSGSINTSKSYMLVAFFKTSSQNMDGRIYHGCGPRPSGLKNLSGVDRSNPYFSYGDADILPHDTWCVGIGFIHHKDANISDMRGTGGVFRMDTQQRILGFSENDMTNETWSSSEYKLASTASDFRCRVYHYYSVTQGEYIDMYGPGIFEINTGSPDVGDIVSGNFVVN